MNIKCAECSDSEAEGQLSNLKSLQAQLAAAVSGEDYATAASLRDQLASLEFDGELGALAANAEFYRAFASQDLTAMQELWLDDGELPRVACAHPGYPPIYGCEEVMDSWKQVFQGAQIKISAKQVRCHVLGAMARITCTEEIESGGQTVAVNIFEWDGERWRMVLHYAGPCLV